MTDEPNPEFVKVPEIAEVLGVSRPMIYRLVHDGEIPSVKVGSLYLVPRTWLEEMRRLGGIATAT